MKIDSASEIQALVDAVAWAIHDEPLRSEFNGQRMAEHNLQCRSILAGAAIRALRAALASSQGTLPDEAQAK